MCWSVNYESVSQLVRIPHGPFFVYISKKKFEKGESILDILSTSYMYKFLAVGLKYVYFEYWQFFFLQISMYVAKTLA